MIICNDNAGVWAVLGLHLPCVYSRMRGLRGPVPGLLAAADWGPCHTLQEEEIIVYNKIDLSTIYV